MGVIMFMLAGMMGLLVAGSVMFISTEDTLDDDPSGASEDEDADFDKTTALTFDDESEEDHAPSLLDQLVETVPDYISQGSDNADKLIGEDAGDLMNGFAEDDTISGGAGDDQLHGEDGADSLSGDAGDDTLHGGADDDLLFGGDDDDELYGHDGADILFGEAGDDSLNGGLADDTLNGGTGDDALHGRHGADELNGGEGEDTLFGGWGNDTLDGRDASRDFLNGGDGDDLLRVDADDIASGGKGADSFYFSEMEEDEDAAQLMDFDPAEDKLVVLVDDDMFGEDEPDIQIEPDAQDAMYSNLTVNGVIVAQMKTADAPSVSQIALMSEEAANALFDG